MPACISRGEKSKSEKQCQESRLTEFTDWQGTEQSCFCSRLQLPRETPTPSFAAGPSVHPLLGNDVPHSVQNQPQGEREVSWFTEHRDSRWESGLTFHAHAVVKAFVVEAPVVGRAEMLPQVTAGPCRHSKHMWSTTLSGLSLPPCPWSHWTGDPSSPWQGCALAEWTIWCARFPARTTDGWRDRGPEG